MRRTMRGVNGGRSLFDLEKQFVVNLEEERAAASLSCLRVQPVSDG